MAAMHRKDYDKRLAEVRKRKSELDDYGNFQKSILTDSFNRQTIPETVKYVYESMEPVTDEYTTKTYEEADRVQKQMSAGFQAANCVLSKIKYMYQGSVPCNTHIKVHSDLDILVVQDKFYYGVEEVSPWVAYAGKPIEELKELRQTAYDKLKSSYPKATVTNHKPKCIQISGGSLKRKFDIIIASCANTQEYVNTKHDHLRGIKLHCTDDTDSKFDFPFLNIHEINKKDTSFLVDGNLRRLVRLLKSLKMDADSNIDLSSFMITSLIFHMNEWSLLANTDNLSKLLVEASKHLDKILTDVGYRLSLKSPNGHEDLFKSSDTKPLSEIRKLKSELDDTIADLADDFNAMGSRVNQRVFEKGSPTNSYPNLSSKHDVLNNATFNYYTNF